MIRAEATVDVARPPAEVFRFVDDFARMPGWHSLCVQLEQTSPPPRRAGSTVRYTFKQSGHTQTLEGRLSDYDPGRRLTFEFADKSFHIVVDFDLRASGAGTSLTHAVEIEPQGLLGKVATPMIRAATQKQVAEDTARLGRVLEAA